jgi:hypothetical protein
MSSRLLVLVLVLLVSWKQVFRLVFAVLLSSSSSNFCHPCSNCYIFFVMMFTVLIFLLVCLLMYISMMNRFWGTFSRWLLRYCHSHSGSHGCRLLSFWYFYFSVVRSMLTAFAVDWNVRAFGLALFCHTWRFHVSASWLADFLYVPYRYEMLFVVRYTALPVWITEKWWYSTVEGNSCTRRTVLRTVLYRNWASQSSRSRYFQREPSRFPTYCTWYCTSTGTFTSSSRAAGFKYGTLLHILCSCTYCTGTWHVTVSLDRSPRYSVVFFREWFRARALPTNGTSSLWRFCDTRPRKSPSTRFFGVEGAGICKDIGRLSDVITCVIRYLHVEDFN